MKPKQCPKCSKYMSEDEQTIYCDYCDYEIFKPIQVKYLEDY